MRQHGQSNSGFIQYKCSTSVGYLESTHDMIRRGWASGLLDGATVGGGWPAAILRPISCLLVRVHRSIVRCLNLRIMTSRSQCGQ